MEYSYTPPTEFRAGETVVWKLADDADFPEASSWAAKATISGRNGSLLVAAAFTDGEWVFTITAATNILTAGSYILYQFFTKGSGASEETYPIGDITQLTISKKLTTAVTTDLRTHAQKMLALIETALENFASDNAIHTQQIEGKMYSRTDINQLYALRNKYSRLESGTTFTTIPVVFQPETETE